MMNSNPPRIRIALLDDHPVVRFGLSTRLEMERDIEIVGIYDNATSVIAGLRSSRTDILVMDYALGPSDMDGVSLLKAISLKFPAVKIIVISSYYEPATVSLTFRLGARGFVGKEEGLAEVVKAIRIVAAGETYLDPTMSYQIAFKTNKSSRLTESSSSVELSELSMREREVIRCFLDGLTVSEIALKFNRSIKTISTQKASAYRKLGIKSDNGLFKIKEMLGDI